MKGPQAHRFVKRLTESGFTEKQARILGTKASLPVKVEG